MPTVRHPQKGFTGTVYVGHRIARYTNGTAEVTDLGVLRALRQLGHTIEPEPATPQTLPAEPAPPAKRRTSDAPNS